MTVHSLTAGAGTRPRPATSPRRPPPPGACDCHVHISDASGRFPLRRQLGYEPPDATLEVHRATLRVAGLERSVAVQLLAYGGDNTLMCEALVNGKGALRGVAELTQYVSDAELERLHAAGVRGLRFYFELPSPLPGVHAQGVGLDDLVALAPRMKALGWVAEISASCERVLETAPVLQSLGVPIVLEHMAGCLAAKGAADPGFRKMLGLLDSGAFWVKLTLCRMSKTAPDYEDLRPLHDAFIIAAPQRLIWGSDWPHVGMGDNAPDVGHLLDLFDAWIEHDARLRQAILTDNPARLFGF